MDDKFEPREVYLAEDAPIPDSMRKHVKEGGSLYMVEEPHNNKAFISTAESPNGNFCTYVSMDYVRQEVRLHEDELFYMPNSIKQHIQDGGKLYAVGKPMNGVVHISTNKEIYGHISIDVGESKIDYVNASEQDFADAVANIPDIESVNKDVVNDKIDDRSDENIKTFSFIANSLIGKATDPNHKYGGSHLQVGGPYSLRDEVYKSMVWWLSDRRGDVLSYSGEKDGYAHVDNRAFDENGNIRTEITISIGQDVKQSVYTEVGRHGWYLYPSAKDMDDRNSNTVIYMDNAMDAVNTHVMTVIAKAERLEAINNFVNDFCKDELYEKDQVEHRLKDLPDDVSLKEQLQAAQKALDDKRAIAREDPAYKALLIPGKNESITTMFDLGDDFSEAVESIGVTHDGLEQ